MIHILTTFSATLAAFFLNEKLGEIGRLGCALCLIGAIIITLHAPPDRDIKTVDEIWSYALKPGKYPGHYYSNAPAN